MRLRRRSPSGLAKAGLFNFLFAAATMTSSLPARQAPFPAVSASLTDDAFDRVEIIFRQAQLPITSSWGN
jgi:hypothetical protein